MCWTVLAIMCRQAAANRSSADGTETARLQL
jgi:hypothetical protein